MTEFGIKNILSELLFGNRICESADDRWIVNYLYDELLLERLLYGEPVTVPELRALLHKKILNFKFIKLDGEIRPAKGTTMMKYIPQAAHPKGIRPSSPKVATFYDLEKDDWRSVSQRSKEIVLDKDEETGKPVIMVKDKPEGGDVAIRDKGKEVEPDIEEPEVTPEITPEETPIETPIDQPELTVDDKPVDIDTKVPVAQVTKVKPIESTDEKKTFHLVNPKTGASKDIETTAKELMKELKRMGREWQVSDKEDFEETEENIKKSVEEEPDVLNVGDKREYLNRKGENVEIEITGEDPYGGFYAKTPKGGMFKIPASKMRNVGELIKHVTTKTMPKSDHIINKKEDLENKEAKTI